MCPCRGSSVLSATVELTAILVNSKACARACVVLELEQVRDWQSQRSIVLLLFLQKQNLANAIYLSGLSTLLN